jgi:streptogramin lyase/subtilisin-like proprotein convertase family protein
VTAGVPGRSALAGLVLLCGCALFPPAAGAAAGTVTEFPTPTAESLPQGITTGPDGNLWFTEYAANKIGRITRTGAIGTSDEFTIPTTSSGPVDITHGPMANDFRLWFTESNSDKIGRITTTGAITETAAGTLPATSEPRHIAPGPDNDLWFTERFTSKIARITPGFAAYGDFATPTSNSSPVDIAPGHDGRMWLVEEGADKVGRKAADTSPITTADEFALPGPSGSLPQGLTPGPDGNLWFTEYARNQIGRITPAGAITEFPIPSSGSGPFGITPGPDGNLWFTQREINRIGRIDPADGSVTEFPLPANRQPNYITAGPDGNIWFTEDGTPGRIARITTALDPPQFSNTPVIDVPGSCPSPGMCGGPADPYPSEIAVSGLQGTVTSVRVRLREIMHEGMAEVDVLLVGPQGQAALVLSDVGGVAPDPIRIDVNFADAASFAVPVPGPLIPGLYKPTDNDPGSDGDTFPSPAPPAPYSAALSTFNGTNPNGTWKLFVADDGASGGAGKILGGWGLDIETTGPPPANEGGGTTTPAQTCAGKTATITGTAASDNVKGTNGKDVIALLGGDDTAKGRGGNDLICGGSGNDRLNGDQGRDKLFGDQGRDKLNGGGKKDTCNGGSGKDRGSACEKGPDSS